MTRPVFRLPEELANRIVAHCLAALPDEGCGLFAMNEESVVEVYPTTNATPSPVAYTVPPGSHFAALRDAEAKGWRLGGAFHSHPYGDAELSMVDLQAVLEPEWVYLVVGMRAEPELRAWRVRDGDLEEISVTVFP